MFHAARSPFFDVGFPLGFSFFIQNLRTIDVNPFPSTRHFCFENASWLQAKDVIPNHKQVFWSKKTIWPQLTQVKFHTANDVFVQLQERVPNCLAFVLVQLSEGTVESRRCGKMENFCELLSGELVNVVTKWCKTSTQAQLSGCACGKSHELFSGWG